MATKAVTTKKSESISKAKLVDFMKVAGVANSATDAEKTKFIEICQAYGLDPFKREIHFTKYGNQAASIVIGYEVYIKRAERTGLLQGWNVTTEGRADLNNPQNSDLKAIVTIYRSDWEHPFTWEAYFDEFVGITRDGNVSKFWQKARFMTKKVAIAQAFRLCFSDELGGLPHTDAENEVGLADIAEEIKADNLIAQEYFEKVNELGDLNEAGKQEARAELQEQEQEQKPDLTKIIKQAKRELDEAGTRADVNEIWKKYRELQIEDQFVTLCKHATIRVDTAKK